MKMFSAWTFQQFGEFVQRQFSLTMWKSKHVELLLYLCSSCCVYGVTLSTENALWKVQNRSPSLIVTLPSLYSLTNYRWRRKLCFLSIHIKIIEATLKNITKNYHASIILLVFLLWNKTTNDIIGRSGFTKQHIERNKAIHFWIKTFFGFYT